MSNRLAILAADIHHEHEAAQRSSEDAAEHAYSAGRMLAEAKARDDIPFGDWDRWVREEAGVPPRTARRYIQLFDAVEQGAVTIPDIAKAGQLGALKMAAKAVAEGRRQASRSAVVIPDGMDLRIGDARIVLNDIAPNSVPLILTDPPYGDEAEPLYVWLAEFARRVLIPGGSLICYTGQSRLDRDMRILGESLRYWWLLAMLHDQTQRFPGKFVVCEFKPVLWYVKEFRRGRTMLPDILRSSYANKDEHNWGQGEGGIGPVIEHLTEPGELIVDPFAGTATWGKRALAMGRRWIGADIAVGGSEAVAAA